MITGVPRSVFFLFLAALLTCLTGCAGLSRPGHDAFAALDTLRQQFADGRYPESMSGCRAIINARSDCAARGPALYYGALNSLRLTAGEAGRAEAAGYLRRLIGECPGSPYRPEAEAWLGALFGPANHNSAPEPDTLEKKDREIKNLRGQVERLNREIDQLKDVDVRMHRQKKDLDDGTGERKNSRP